MDFAGGAHASHAGGSPISQRLIEGEICRLGTRLDGSELPVAARDPDGVGPEAVKNACLGNWSSLSRPSRCAVIPDVSFQSVVAGVAHDVKVAWSEREVSEIPSCEPASAALRLRSRNASAVPPASCAAGVAHEATVGTSSPRFVFLSRISPLFASPWSGVGHVARRTTLPNWR